MYTLRKSLQILQKITVSNATSFPLYLKQRNPVKFIQIFSVSNRISLQYRQRYSVEQNTISLYLRLGNSIKQNSISPYFRHRNSIKQNRFSLYFEQNNPVKQKRFSLYFRQANSAIQNTATLYNKQVFSVKLRNSFWVKQNFALVQKTFLQNFCKLPLHKKN